MSKVPIRIKIDKPPEGENSMMLEYIRHKLSRGVIGAVAIASAHMLALAVHMLVLPAHTLN